MDNNNFKQYIEREDFQYNYRTVKELDPDEQPREKAEKYGCAFLSIPELLALILRTGTHGNPITQLCRDLMHANDNSLHRLERRTRMEIRNFKGIGTTKSIQIEAIMELIKRYCEEDIPIDEPIREANQIYNIMRHKIGNLDHEEIWVLFLNRRNNVIKQMKLTSGTSNASLFDVKKVIKHALLENAEAVILCHNHPSGTLQPSASDDHITHDLLEACRYMNIKLLDHVIVTANGFYSYNDRERLK